MSTVMNSLPTGLARLTSDQDRRLWVWAVVCPLAVLPVWLTVPQTVLGPLHSVSGLLLTMLLTTSAVTDLIHRKIYNWATYTTFAWAIAINSLPGSLPLDLGAVGLIESFYGGAVCFLVMLFPYCLARGGAGDVKLAAAIGALLGAESGLLIIAFTYIVSALAIVGWTVWTQGPLHLLSAVCKKTAHRIFPQMVLPPNEQQKLLLEQPVPLAGFFLIATTIVLFDLPMIWRGL